MCISYNDVEPGAADRSRNCPSLAHSIAAVAGRETNQTVDKVGVRSALKGTQGYSSILKSNQVQTAHAAARGPGGGCRAANCKLSETIVRGASGLSARCTCDKYY